MRTLYIIALTISGLFVQAQTDLFFKLNSFLSNQTKEKVENRLIALNIWSTTDKTSRTINDEFDEAYKVYEYAKLKGGKNGIIVLNINLENDVVNADITLEKDGITKVIKVPSDNTEIISALKGKSPGYNIVYDEKGTVVYENLKEGTIFSAIQKLITR